MITDVWKYQGESSTISTYYLNHDYADSTANQLDISNSVIHGSITSMLPGGYYDRFDADGNNLGGYDFYTDAVVDTHWRDGDVFTLNIANTTIDDDYEALYFTDSYKDGDVTKHTNETFDTSEGVAVNLDVESNINISNNSRVAGIALSQGNTYNETYTTESHTWDNNISVKDSTVTSGSNYILIAILMAKLVTLAILMNRVIMLARVMLPLPAPGIVILIRMVMIPTVTG